MTLFQNSKYFGFNPPFIGGHQGVLSRQEDVRLIKNDLLQLLLTVPGERIHRPTFGTPIRQTVFDPNDNLTSSNLLTSIETIIAAEEPRLANVDVTITQRRDDLQIDITISAVLTNEPSIDFLLQVAFDFNDQTVTTQETTPGAGITTQNTGPLSGRQ